MNEKEFISKIKSLKNDIIVDDSFFDSNKKKFLNFVSSEFNEKSSKLNFDFVSLFNKIKIPGFAIGASACVISVFGFTVSASLRAIPGDPLYSFKISMENTRVAMTFDDSKSVDLQVQFAGNRIDELSMIMNSNRLDKQKVASDLVNKIDDNLSDVPSKVIALNNKNKSLETTAKVFDDKMNEYSDKLKKVKDIANDSGMDELIKEIDLAYIKGNSVAVKTLNIVVQNIDLSVDNTDLKRDIINRVEKKVDNIKEIVDPVSKTVVINDSNDIINESSLNENAENSVDTSGDNNKNTNINKNENGGSSTLIEQLQDMKKELQKAKIGLASIDMASIINSIDKGLNNTIISTVPLSPVMNINNKPNNAIDTNNKENNDKVIDEKDIIIEDITNEKDVDFEMQFETGIGYGLNFEENNIGKNDFNIESLWNSGE